MRLSNQDLEQIVSASKERNLTEGITGILIYHDGSFLQVLEGASSALARTMARIESDSRHRSVITLLRKPITEREFGQWSMELITPQSGPSPLGGSASQAQVLMRSFAHNAR